MDVTCERCGTEYEFDETLLSGKGTSVKCTNCGHVFKVYPKAQQADAGAAASSWKLRLADDSIDEIDSLRELQRRIASGELTPANEISRGDDGWKTLGSIPELETFFQAAGVQIASGRIPSPLPPPQTPVPPVTSGRDSSLPSARRPRQPTLLGVMPVQRMSPEATTEPLAEPASASMAASESVQASAPEPTAESVSGSPAASGANSDSVLVDEALLGSAPASADDSYRSSYISDPGPTPETASRASAPPPAEEIEDAEFEEPLPQLGRSAVRTSTPPPAYYDDDDDIPGLPGRGGSPLRWLLLIVLLGGLILVWVQWPRIARLVGIGSDPALIAAGISEGDAGIAEGYPEAYANAIEAYGRAIEAGGDRDAEILAKLSNAYALAAQAQIDAGAPAERVAALVRAALTTATSAVELEPLDLEPKLGRADALRLTGESDEARKTLEQARAMSFSRTAEFFRVDARLSAAEAGGDLEAGLRSANQAAELAPAGVPYLLLLSRSELAAGDEEAARSPLERVLADRPDHPVAKRLLAELEAKQLAETNETTESVADAGIAANAAATVEAETEKAEEDVEAALAVAARKPVASKPAPRPAPKAARKPRAPAEPAYDEYDRLVAAAGDDDFVDGRPPVRDYEWYMEQGRAELAGGNYSRARAFFDSALEARPGSADAMDGLGKVSTRIEDFDSAIRYFRVAAQRGQSDGYFNLGKTYERVGRNEEAVSAYYTYLKRRPSGTHAAAARAAIKTLEPRAKLPPEPESEPDTATEPEPELQPESEPAAVPETESEPPPAEEPAQETEPTTP